jgi:hypothetical protein
MLLGVFETMAHFIEDIEVILNVLNGAVLGELVLERFDLFLGGIAGFAANRVTWQTRASVTTGAEVLKIKSDGQKVVVMRANSRSLDFARSFKKRMILLRSG